MEKDICINCNEDIHIDSNSWFHTTGMYRCDGFMAHIHGMKKCDIAVPYRGLIHKRFLEELQAL